MMGSLTVSQTTAQLDRMDARHPSGDVLEWRTVRARADLEERYRRIQIVPISLRSAETRSLRSAAVGQARKGRESVVFARPEI